MFSHSIIKQFRTEIKFIACAFIFFWTKKKNELFILNKENCLLQIIILHY